MLYLVLCLSFGLAGGLVGRIKGSSFWMWFLISAVLPFLGLAGALLYRVDREELRRQCPTCGRLVMLYDQVCTRCGMDLDFPDVAVESQAAVEERQGARPPRPDVGNPLVP